LILQLFQHASQLIQRCGGHWSSLLLLDRLPQFLQQLS
jgi:hypothetical protein